MILAARFIFIVERSWKNMYFHPKLAWPPATYDVISHSHSNWSSLNFSQNVCEGWMNSYWKLQVLMFYPLGKKFRKTLWGASTPRPLYVRGLIYSWKWRLVEAVWRCSLFLAQMDWKLIGIMKFEISIMYILCTIKFANITDFTFKSGQSFLSLTN